MNNQPVVITREQQLGLEPLFGESVELESQGASLTEWQTLMIKAYKLGRQHSVNRGGCCHCGTGCGCCE